MEFYFIHLLMYYVTIIQACANLQKTVLPHETDCLKYIYYKRGIVKEGQCPYGYVFDIDTLSCETKSARQYHKSLHPRNRSPSKVEVLSGSVQPMTEYLDPICENSFNGKVADPHHCKFYYSCTFGHSRHYKCPFLLYFSSSKLKCVPKREVDCDALTTLTTNRPKTTSSKITLTTVTSSTIYTFSTNGCPDCLCDGHNTWLKPDSLHCKRYFSCSFGKIYHLKCSDGKEFSPVELKCMDKDEANCFVTTTTFLTATATSTTTPTISSRSTITTKQIPDRSCSFYEVWFNPDYNDCKYYYLCILGHLSHVACPIGQDYSKEKGKCMDRDKANCLVTTTTLLSTMTSSNTTPSISNTTTKRIPTTLATSSVTTERSTITTKQIPDRSCKFYEVWFIPDYNDCKYYYRCNLGHLSHVACPTGQDYSKEKRKCMDRDKANCLVTTTTLLTTIASSNTTPIISSTTTKRTPTTLTTSSTTSRRSPITTTQIPGPSCSGNEIWFLPDYTDCKYFYMCLLGHLSHEACPIGQDYTKEKEKCMDRDKANCFVTTTTLLTTIASSNTTPIISSTTTKRTPTTLTTSSTTAKRSPITTTQIPGPSCSGNEIWFIPDYTNCNHFYMCILGYLSHVACPNAQEYSKENQKCMDKDEANCLVTMTTVTSTTTPTISSTTTERTPTTLTTSSTTTKPSSITTIQLTGLSCSDNEVWFIPDYNNCKYYYQCILGYLSHVECPDDEEFSKEKATCLNKKWADFHVTTTPSFTTASNTTEDSPTTSLTTPSSSTDCDHHTAWLKPDITSCIHYYLCLFGTISRKECPDGDEFSPDSYICINKNESNCTLRHYTTSSILPVAIQFSTRPASSDSTPIFDRL